MAMIDQRQMLPMATVLDRRYRIVRHLASGGFGNTYVAEDMRLGGRVAVKEFFMRGTNHRSTDHTTVEVSNDANTPVFNTQLKKFQREARRIFELRNDHIIHVSDLFDANGTSYYVMDLVNGTSLAEQTLPEQEARDVILQVLDALEAMHDAGLYHLDVKPGNIMRDDRGHCTLIDFGASKQLTADERGTLSSSTMAYTPGYAPLEQVAQQSKNIGPWTDFFALGATLYRLVTGNPPPEVDSDDTEPDGRQFDYPPTVGDSLRHTISTLMNPSRRMRPKSAAEVRRLLQEQSGPVASPQPEAPAPSEETVITDPTPEPTAGDEQTRRIHTPVPPPIPSDDSDHSESSENSENSGHSESSDHSDGSSGSSSPGKGLWYGLAGIAAVILLVFVLAKGCNTKKTGDSALASYTQCPDENHPHLIDLGLPSGTKWACCNVGAAKPEGDGGYYAWGETDEKSDYSWETYEHCDGTAESCHNLGSSICGTQYDVAHVKWGGAWQMPTEDQIIELKDKCKHEWTTVNGVSGRRFTGPNGGSIFLPAAGGRYGAVLSYHGSWGRYWSGTQSTSGGGHACGLNFASDGADWYGYYRSYGFSVRPVAR